MPRLPSIADCLAAAPSIDALAAMRDRLAEMARSGDLELDARTRRRWNGTLWVRVLELIQAPDAPDCPSYVHNVTLRWPKPDGLGEAIVAAVRAKAATMPVPAAAWGIPQ